MWQDPIVAEIHKFREEYAARFNNDMDAIFADIRKRQEQSSRPCFSFARPKLEAKKNTI